MKMQNHVWMVIAIHVNEAERDRDQLIAVSIDFPLPKSCWRFGEMEEPPSGGNVLQATQASPDDLDTRFAITLAPQETSQASNPVDCLVQGRRLLWGGRRLMNGGIQRLPFLLLQQHLTTGLGCLSRFIGEP